MVNPISDLANIFGFVAAITSIYDSTISPAAIYILIIFTFILWIRNGLKIFAMQIDYRFVVNPGALDIVITEIKSESKTINLFLSDNAERSRLGKILSHLRCKLLIIIKCPEGVKVAKERLSSEFDTWNEVNGCLMLGKNITASGRRVVKFYVNVESQSGFAGNSPISVKVYIAPKMRGFRQLSSLVFGSLSDRNINILPSSR